MSTFIQATTFGAKPGKYEEAEAEMKRWVAGFQEAGATVRLFKDPTDGSGMVTISVEWPNAERWATGQEDERMLGVQRRLSAGEMPFVIGNITLLEELPLPT